MTEEKKVTTIFDKKGTGDGIALPKGAATHFFKKELEFLQDESIRVFFHNALVAAPESFYQDTEAMTLVKRAYHILRGFMEARGVQGSLRDALLGTVLICDIMVNEFKEEQKNLHAVAVRGHLKAHGVDKDIQQPLWENILRAVEAHEGAELSPILDAKPGTAEFELLQAFNVARMNYVTIDWEVI